MFTELFDTIQLWSTLKNDLEFEEASMIVTTGNNYNSTIPYGMHQMESMKMGKRPIPKDEFIEALELMREAGIIERLEREGKIIWKRIES